MPVVEVARVTPCELARYLEVRCVRVNPGRPVSRNRRREELVGRGCALNTPGSRKLEPVDGVVDGHARLHTSKNWASCVQGQVEEARGGLGAEATPAAVPVDQLGDWSRNLTVHFRHVVTCP